MKGSGYYLVQLNLKISRRPIRLPRLPLAGPRLEEAVSTTWDLFKMLMTSDTSMVPIV